MIIKDLMFSRWIYPLLKKDKVTGFFAFMLIGSGLFAQSGIPELTPVTQTYVLQNVQIVVRPGQIISGGTVIIQDGLILAAGKEVAIPAHARKIKADSMFVYAGFIEGLSQSGIPRPEAASSAAGARTPGQGQQRPRVSDPWNPTYEEAGITPYVRVRDVFKADDKSIEEMRKLGFTAAQVFPIGKMLPGQASLISLGTGKNADELLLKENTGLIASFSPASGAFPSTIIGVISRLRELYKNAARLQEYQKNYNANPLSVNRPVADKCLEAFFPVLDGKVPLIFQAPDMKSVYRVQSLKNELKFGLHFADLKEGSYVADLLKAEGKPIIISLDLPKAAEEKKPATDSSKTIVVKDAEMEALKARTAEEMKRLEGQASKLAALGLPFSFSTVGVKATDIKETIRRMIKAGLTEDQALAALTTTPAAQLGVSNRFGTVEKGRAANLVVSDKSYFDEKSSVRYVFIDGKMFEYEGKPAPKAGGNTNAAGKGAEAPKVAGKWSYTIKAPGMNSEGVLTFKGSGNDLTGEWTSSQVPGSNPISNVSVDGNKLSFSSNISMGSRQVTLDFNLIIDGNSLSGTVGVGTFGTFDVSGAKIDGQ
ncbi:MAG: hypothetical protein EBS35_05325 [Bacteroidetes bacterium]|nr:hypothetical protein [Bacteroidota bacterium]